MPFTPSRTSMKAQPEFLRNTKGLHYSTGNVVFDRTKLTSGQKIKPGTAIYKIEGSDKFALVEAATPATMAEPMLTRDPITYNGEDENPITSAVVSCYAIEPLCTGVTDNFKKAAQGRISFY